MTARPRSGVDMRRLHYFVAVCEHGGFSRAAQAIGIAQPALTRQIKALEVELGGPLFKRNGRNALPTDVGRYLLDHARAHLDGLDTAIERIRRDFRSAPARVTLGMCPTIAPLFAGALEGACAPGTELTVIEAYSGDLRSLMAVGRIDLSLTYRPREAEGLTVRPLLTETLVFAAPSLTSRAPIRLAEIGASRLILPSRIHELRGIIDRVAEREGVSLSQAVEIDNLTAVKSMLADIAGGYATILPFHSVAEDVKAGTLALRPFVERGMERTITMIRRKDRAADLPQGLCDAIRRRADEIAGEAGTRDGPDRAIG